MITDEKRRRVVHTLRQLDHIVDDEDCDPEDFTYCPECRAEVVDE